MQGARLVEVFDGGVVCNPVGALKNQNQNQNQILSTTWKKKNKGTKISALTEEPVLRLLLLDWAALIEEANRFFIF